MAKRSGPGSRDRRRRQMERLLARRKREGLSYRELSELSGVPIGTLAAWQRRLETGAWPSAGGGKSRRRARRREPVSFVEAAVTPPAAAGAPRTCEIVLASGHRVVVEEGFEPSSLAAVLEVVARTC